MNTMNQISEARAFGASARRCPRCARWGCVMSGSNGKVRPNINTEIRRLQRTVAVLICLQAAAEEGTDADMGDALAVVVALVNEWLAALDRLEGAP
jgi:hypothetical protein